MIGSGTSASGTSSGLRPSTQRYMPAGLRMDRAGIDDLAAFSSGVNVGTDPAGAVARTWIGGTEVVVPVAGACCDSRRDRLGLDVAAFVLVQHQHAACRTSPKADVALPGPQFDLFSGWRRRLRPILEDRLLAGQRRKHPSPVMCGEGFCYTINGGGVSRTRHSHATAFCVRVHYQFSGTSTTMHGTCLVPKRHLLRVSTNRCPFQVSLLRPYAAASTKARVLLSTSPRSSSST